MYIIIDFIELQSPGKNFRRLEFFYAKSFNNKKYCNYVTLLLPKSIQFSFVNLSSI